MDLSPQVSDNENTTTKEIDQLQQKQRESTQRRLQKIHREGLELKARRQKQSSAKNMAEPTASTSSASMNSSCVSDPTGTLRALAQAGDHVHQTIVQNMISARLESDKKTTQGESKKLLDASVNESVMRQKKIQELERQQKKSSRRLKEKKSEVAELKKVIKLRDSSIENLLSSAKTREERNLQLQKSLKEAEDIVSDGILDAQDRANSPAQRRLSHSLKNSQDQVKSLKDELDAARRLADMQRQDSQKLQHKVNKQVTDLMRAEKEVESLRKHLEDSTAKRIEQIALRRQESLLGSSSTTRDVGTAMIGTVNLDPDLDQVHRVISNHLLTELKREEARTKKYRTAAKNHAKILQRQNRAWQQKNDDLLRILRQAHASQRNLQK